MQIFVYSTNKTLTATLDRVGSSSMYIAQQRKLHEYIILYFAFSKNHYTTTLQIKHQSGADALVDLHYNVLDIHDNTKLPHAVVLQVKSISKS